MELAGTCRMRLLSCHHCNSSFDPSDSQWKKRLGRKAYCSEVCRYADVRARLCTEVPTRGPCPTCGEKFKSRRAEKIFCSMRCYTSSPKFLEMVRANCRLGNRAAKAKVAVDRPTYVVERECLECSKIFEQKRWKRKNKFCSSMCYRTYMSKRFDRWLASPQDLALPQNYDEFMTQDELPCLLPGCEWRGQHLSTHMQLAHGITAAEIKRAAGFNLSTGLVAPDLHKKLCDRVSVGVAALDASEMRKMHAGMRRSKIISYRSKEAVEHVKKSRLLLLDGPGPKKVCLCCGSEFIQSTVFGATKFCSIACRQVLFNKKNRTGVAPAKCSFCSQDFLANKTQIKKRDQGRPVACSRDCRNKMNIQNCPNHRKSRAA